MDVPSYNSIHVQMHITLFPAIYNLIKQANSTLLDETYSLNKVAAEPTLARDYDSAKRRYERFENLGAYNRPPGQKDQDALNARNEYKLLQGMQSGAQPYNPNIISQVSPIDGKTYHRGVNRASIESGTDDMSYWDMYTDTWRRTNNTLAQLTGFTNPGEELYPLEYPNQPWLDAGNATNLTGGAAALAAGAGALGTGLAGLGSAGSGGGTVSTAVGNTSRWLGPKVINWGRNAFPQMASFARDYALPGGRFAYTLATQGPRAAFTAGQIPGLISGVFGASNIYNAWNEMSSRLNQTGNAGQAAWHGAKQYAAGIPLNPFGALTYTGSHLVNHFAPEGMLKTVAGAPARVNFNPAALTPESFAPADYLRDNERATALQLAYDAGQPVTTDMLSRLFRDQGYNPDFAPAAAENAVRAFAAQNYNRLPVEVLEWANSDIMPQNLPEIIMSHLNRSYSSPVDTPPAP